MIRRARVATPGLGEGLLAGVVRNLAIRAAREAGRTIFEGRVRLRALLEADELCVCDLSDATGLTQTACSHNLRLLRAQRLVRYRKQGRNVYYTLDDDHIRVLLEVALQHVTHG